MIYKVYGPPGTGKTHSLISRAKAYARVGVPLHRIGYFAFTKKAAQEAIKRMPAEEKQLPYFQTLHAFSFHTLALKEEDIMQPYHYEDLGKILNIRVNYVDKYNEEETHYLTNDNPYFQLIGRAINRDITIREEFDRNEHDKKYINWDTLKHIHHNLIEYKKQNQLKDFNDIIKGVTLKMIKDFDVVFIDEAQDLSPLQWKLYDLLKQKATDIYLAGDDDQAIFAWAGADVERFIREPAKEKILKYSKRISKAVQEESNIITNRIVGSRKIKDYLPNSNKGETQYISNLGQVDLSKGKWLILTRTRSTLLKIMEELKKANLYFQSKKGKSFRVSMYNAKRYYDSWKSGKELDDKYFKDIKEFTGDVELDKTISWFDAFINADLTEKNYIRQLLERGERLDEDARIWLSTIHAIKGGEEDNVILSLEQGDKIQKAIKKSFDKQDEEHRVWYVAVTRARHNLYKLKAKIKRKGYNL